jgi:large subunit ribosomal protein L37e
MTKGTTSLGKRTKKTHIVCRRCGKRSYHIRKKTCASCGFGSKSKLRQYNWVKKQH